MIVVDIETSGLDYGKAGIWQIGAIDFYHQDNYFLEEARIDDEDILEEGAAKVSGVTLDMLRDKSRQSQKQMLTNFFNWLKNIKVKNFICENPQFDWAFISIKARNYGLEIPFHHRCFDLHSLASLKYFQLNNQFLIKEDHSDMSLPNCLKFCGIEDTRRKVEGNVVLKEGKPHNALEDCKLEAECFSRIVYGKEMLEEYKKFKIPDYLKNKK